VVASVLFGLVHAITRAYVVIAALFGAYLGWLWLVTGDLTVPIVVHALYDFLVLVYLMRRPAPTGAMPTAGEGISH
jgi:membrane protease YdiL (CAAX protease family)